MSLSFNVFYYINYAIFIIIFRKKKRKRTLEKAQLLSPRERKCYYRTDCSSRLRRGICCKRQTTSGI